MVRSLDRFQPTERGENVFEVDLGRTAHYKPLQAFIKILWCKKRRRVDHGISAVKEEEKSSDWNLRVLLPICWSAGVLLIHMRGVPGMYIFPVSPNHFGDVFWPTGKTDIPGTTAWKK